LTSSLKRRSARSPRHDSTRWGIRAHGARVGRGEIVEPRSRHELCPQRTAASFRGHIDLVTTPSDETATRMMRESAAEKRPRPHQGRDFPRRAAAASLCSSTSSRLQAVGDPSSWRASQPPRDERVPFKVPLESRGGLVLEGSECEQPVNTCTRVRVAGYARDTPPRARVRSSPIALYGVASAIVDG
jgi:hypothetical protein